MRHDAVCGLVQVPARHGQRPEIHPRLSEDRHRCSRCRSAAGRRRRGRDQGCRHEPGRAAPRAPVRHRVTGHFWEALLETVPELLAAARAS